MMRGEKILTGSSANILFLFMDDQFDLFSLKNWFFTSLAGFMARENVSDLHMINK